MTQLKLNIKNSYLTKFKEEFILKYGLLKQEVLDKSKVLATNKNLVQEIFDELLDDPECKDIVFVGAAGNSKDKQSIYGEQDFDNEFLTGSFYYSTSNYDSYYHRSGTPAMGHEGLPDAVISVGALDSQLLRDGVEFENKWQYTNTGPRIDVFAAGVNVLSPWNYGYFDSRSYDVPGNWFKGPF